MQEQNLPLAESIPPEQVRVTAAEITAAIKTIEELKANEAKTISLAQAIVDFNLQTTSEDLLEAVRAVRAQEDEEERLRRRQKHRRLAAIMASCALLTGMLSAYTLSRTVFNPVWQEQQRIADFNQHLALSTGVHPKYHIVIAPNSQVVKYPGLKAGASNNLHMRKVPAPRGPRYLRCCSRM